CLLECSPPSHLPALPLHQMELYSAPERPESRDCAAAAGSRRSGKKPGVLDMIPNRPPERALCTGSFQGSMPSVDEGRVGSKIRARCSASPSPGGPLVFRAGAATVQRLTPTRLPMHKAEHSFSRGGGAHVRKQSSLDRQSRPRPGSPLPTLRQPGGKLFHRDQ